MYLIKGPSLFPDDHVQMWISANTWYCTISQIFLFPLNNIEKDDIYLCEINRIDIDDHNTGSLAERFFYPFELNDRDYYRPLF